MKKFFKLLATLLSLILTATAFTACGGGGSTGTGESDPGIIENEDVNVNEKTITIKCVRAGFGTDWLYDLKTKFESAFADEGYKVNILTPDRSINGDTVVQELYQGYDKMKVDLYITGDVTANMVGANGLYGVLAADLQELVYDKPAVGFNGEDEGKLVSEKLSQDIVPFVQDNLGVKYGFNWVQSSGGLVVNTKKLSQYGLSMPKTTNELLDCFQKIYTGHNGVPNSWDSGNFPITYVPGNNGYAVCFLNTLMAQYDGDFYEQFWTMQDADGAMEDDGYEVFNDDAVLEMLKVAYQTFDLYVTAPGSATHSLSQAQAKIMDSELTDGAVFMFNGDWMLNEVKLTYGDELGDIDFINFPVTSALGTKLFGAGTSYNLSDAKAEEVLSHAIGLVDANASIDEIISDTAAKTGVTLAEADAEEVARARGVSYSRGVEHLAFIPKGSPKKEISSLFLRMMASDDFGKSFSVLANGTTPYYAIENTTSEYKFVRNATKVPTNRYYSLISSGARGFRAEMNILHMFTTTTHLPDHIWSSTHDSIFNDKGGLSGKSASVYTTLASAKQREEYNNVLNNWDNFKQQAGLE